MKISMGYNKNLTLLALCSGFLIGSKDISIYKELTPLLLKISDNIIKFTKGEHKYNIRGVKKLSKHKVEIVLKKLKEEEFLNPPLLTCKIIKNIYDNPKTHNDIKEYLNKYIIDDINTLEEYINTNNLSKMDKFKLNIHYRGLANRVLSIYFS